MATIVKADATGAVLLPAEICRAAGVAPGAELVAEVQDGRIILQRRHRPIWEEIADLTKDIPPGPKSATGVRSIRRLKHNRQFDGL